MERPPAFKLLPRAEQPLGDGYHVLLVHRISDDKQSVVHEIAAIIARDTARWAKIVKEGNIQAQ